MPSKKDLDRFRGEMGENIVSYELLRRGWNVMKNLGGHGFDLLAKTPNNLVQRQIEVKTTDPGLKTGTAKNQLTVVLSDSEMSAADFCIYYIHGYNTFFIIPRAAFPSGGSITVTVSKKDGLISAGSQFEPYRNQWDSLK